jgi:large subunit ribosomal protein L10
MNREQKSVAIAEIAARIEESDAVFAVDYRGISVAQVAELRATLREADASFKVVKNSLTERAADEVGAETLKQLLSGPTALTFVRGDIALAAKAVADFSRATQLLPFKGGLMGEESLEVEQIRSLSRLPSREVLYGQLVGVVASPVSGLVRSLSALIGGLASALGQVREKKESGELPAGDAPASAEAPAEAPAADVPTPDAPAEAPAADAPTDTDADAPADGEPADAETGESAPAEEAAADAPAQEAAAAEAPAQEAAAAEAPAQEASAEEASADDAPAEEALAQDAAAEGPAAAEPQGDESEPATPAQENDKQADVSADAQPEDAETNPTKED